MSSEAPTRTGISFRAFPWAIAGSVIFFLLLWLLDFPQAMCDDIFYAGAGMNLATGGDYSNPWLIRQHFPGHFFFIYPPVHSYILAGWLKLFGINRWAMTAFPLLNDLIASIATIIYLRRQGVPRWIEWLVPLGITAGLLGGGLRPEPVAVALALVGFVMVEMGGRRFYWLALGFFLLSLGAAAAPRATFYVGGLMGFALVRQLKQTDARSAGTIILLAALGVLGALLSFCWMLNFQLGEFWHTFQFHAHVYTGWNKLDLLKLFFTRYIGVTQWPIFIGFLVLLPLAWRAPWRPLKCLAYVMAGMVPVIALVAGLANGTMWYATLAIFGLVASCWEWGLRPRMKLALATVTIGVFLLGNIRTFFSIGVQLSGKTSPITASNRAEVLALESTPEHPVLVDEFVSRYVYDYRLPKNLIYWDFAAGFPAELPIEVKMLPEDIYVLSAVNVNRLNQRHITDVPLPTYEPLRRRWAFFREPERAYILPVKDMKPGE